MSHAEPARAPASSDSTNARRPPMKKQSVSDQTTFHAGDFISEDAVRGVFGRRRTSLRSPADDAGRPAEAATDAENVFLQKRPSPRLRRWSVAELVAGAFARPQVERMGH
jgi:hypothetical protein